MLKHKKILFCFLLGAPFFMLYGQDPEIDKTEIYSYKGIDTNYIYSYSDKLILSLWQSERSFDVLLDTKFSSGSGNSEINYIANSNHVTGFGFDYDIIGFAIGFRSVPAGNVRTGNTDYLDLGLNFNARGLRFENSYKTYTGFYDKNSGNYIQPFNDSTPYFQNKSLNIRTIKSKLIYTFSSRKFSLSSAYANVKRQIKSTGSWLLVFNFYSQSMNSDSSFIPPPLYNDYGVVWDGLNKMNVYAYSLGGGGTYTLVFWKKFYFNVLLSLGLETQYRHYYTQPENVHFKYWKTWFAGDWRTALGYNGKKFFIRVTNVIDLTDYESTDLFFKMKFIAGVFEFGYRFKIKTPEFYQKIKNTELYRKYF